MICPRCDEHHEGEEKLRFGPEKPQWCDDCLEEFDSGRITTRRQSCEELLGCLGIGNGERLRHLDDAADFEAETAGLILGAVREGSLS